MSNIRTSYIRIYKKDGTDITTVEIDMLFNLAVRAYNKFGSYWVRIQKKYRDDEKCLDIQFGSSKTYGEDLLETYEVFNNYDVWERVADEGGYDDVICTLKNNGEYIEKTDLSACMYKFNKVKIITSSLSPSFMSYNPIEIGENEYQLHLEGKYLACNSRGFFELIENEPLFCGPCLQYDATYETDFSNLCPKGHVTKSAQQLIHDIFVYPHKELKINEKVELYWNDRKVQTVERIVNDVICNSADYWDNCADIEYTNFIKNKTVANTK